MVAWLVNLAFVYKCLRHNNYINIEVMDIIIIIMEISVISVGTYIQSRRVTIYIYICNTHIAAIAPLPLTTHPQWWAELLTFGPKCTLPF